jgi:hypothetical protein
MPGGGFASMAPDDGGMNVIFLHRRRPARPARRPGARSDDRAAAADDAAGAVVAFVIDDLEGDLTRIEDADGRIPVPPPGRGRGERAVQVRDGGGAMVQLLGWNAPAGD